MLPQFYGIPGIELRALCILGKHLTDELHSSFDLISVYLSPHEVATPSPRRTS